MSVLRDAKELGYGLDHFMITGENFPSEWQDNAYKHSHNECDDEDAYVINTELIVNNIPNYTDEYIHEHIRRYNSYYDYIGDSIDVNYYKKKTINAKGKTIINEILDITEYIKNIDINEARRQGIIIKSIRYQAQPFEREHALEKNIEAWIRNEKVLLDQVSWTVKYSQKERNERKIHGKASHLVWDQIFSNFKIRRKTGYTSGQRYLMFSELTGQEYSKCKSHPKYNPKETPTMIQIAFGLIKKYGEIEVEIRGYIPGINEPTK